MRRVIVRAPEVLEVADLAALLALGGLPHGRVAIADGQVFANHLGHALGDPGWVPVQYHPLYGPYELHALLDVSALDPTDPDDVVTADLPDGWSKAGTGLLRLVDGELRLTSGVGTSCDLAIALPATDAGKVDKWIALVAEHSWHDDAGLADNATNRQHFALRMAYANRVALWSPSSPTAGWAAIWSTAGSGAALGPIDNPLGYYREVIRVQRGAGNEHLGSVTRLDAPAAALVKRGPMVGARRAGWSSVTEANALTYHVAEGCEIRLRGALAVYVEA